MKRCIYLASYLGSKETSSDVLCQTNGQGVDWNWVTFRHCHFWLTKSNYFKKSVLTKYKTSNYILHIINGYLYFPKLYIMYSPFLLVCKYEKTLLWNPSYSSMNSIIKDKTIFCMEDGNFVSNKVELYFFKYFSTHTGWQMRSLILVN